MNLLKSSLSTLLVLALLPLASAQAMTPIRDPKKLWEPEQAEVYRVKTARVMLADYQLLRRDFPEIASYSDKKIDEWLIRNAANISPEQAAQEVTNTHIETDGKLHKAFRPREYRRAHVFVADTGGLIDAKGTGSIDPHQGNERNGLAALADTFREYLFEKLTSRIFKFEGRFDTVATYGVIDLGFDIKWSNGSVSRAGIVLRQAHARFHEGKIGDRTREDPVVLPTEHQLDVELTLRKYGLTAAINVHPGLYSVTRNGDQLNLQGAQDGSIVDYGGFRAHNNFDLPLYATYNSEGGANVSDADILLESNDRRYVQPDPALKVPFHIWGNTATHSGLDNPYVWSEELSNAIREGRADRSSAEQHFKNLIGPVDEMLKVAAKKRATHRMMICKKAMAS
jgi:hypothetical protein